MIGKTISHYNILEKLGEGGMGVVYKARDTHLDRFVAIKVLPAEKVADPERKERFVKEAKAASSLNHPNIITIYDIGRAEGVDFISMECVSGKTLDQLIPRHGMRLNEALKYAVQIADALARAHSAGIIHRDLKPGNIMVNEHGLMKVLDFGLAKLTEATFSVEDDSTRTMRPTTEEGKIVGTIAYMSPEQAEGKKVDARSDIFSFGSVLYEMVTGRTSVPRRHQSLDDSRHSQGQSPAGKPTCGWPSQRSGATDLPLPAEGSQSALSAHGRRQAGPARTEGRIRFRRAGNGCRVEAEASSSFTWALSVAAALVVATVGVWLVRSKKEVPEAALVAVPLTSYPGDERRHRFPRMEHK